MIATDRDVAVELAAAMIRMVRGGLKQKMQKFGSPLARPVSRILPKL